MKVGKVGRVSTRRRVKVAVALGVVVALNGCGLDKVDIPDFIGPAELALSFRLTASPDLLVADNFSTSLVQAQLRNENGQPVAGRDVYFAIANADLNFAAVGTLNNDPISATVRTAANGIAVVTYRAPARPDATANQSVNIVARPIGDDFNGQVYRSVRIELRSAEPRLFPGRPGNVPPVCGFTVQPAFGPYRAAIQTLSFQNTSFDTDGVIVRYEWDFADGRQSDQPDNAWVFRLPGIYNVRLRVTDNDGARSECSAQIPVI